MIRNRCSHPSLSSVSATALFLFGCFGLVCAANAAVTATTTTLKVTPGTTVEHPAKVTLTATVLTVATTPAPVSPGPVNFCDLPQVPTAASTCTGVEVVGTAQLTATGTAAINFFPGIGTHNYFAVFVGTKTAANTFTTSNTFPQATQPQLVVTGLYPTTTTILASGAVGSYSLTGTVAGVVPSVNIPGPSGILSFLNTNNPPPPGNPVAAKTMEAATTPLVQSFPTQTPAPASGTTPNSVAVGDFNDDGIPDLAVTNVGTDPTKPGTVSVFLGAAGGVYPAAPSHTFTVGDNPVSVAVGDFNNDGLPDLVVVNANDSTISVLLGAANGNFTVEAATPSTVDAGTAVAVGDLNNDGILDLAVSTTGGVAVLLGTGTPTLFGAANVYAAGTSFQSVAIGDFDAGGLPDLAAVSSTNAPGTLAILINAGGGVFPATTPTHTYTVGADPISVAVGDFKNNGILDLAVANSADGTVSVLLGNGDGTFTAAAASPFATGKGPSSVIVGDFNGAGFADLAIANSTDGTVSILIGDGAGAFTAPATSPYTTGKAPLAVAAGDFNGDGLADLATANSTAGTVSVLLNTLTETATATATPVAVTGPATPVQNIEANYLGDTEDTPQLYKGSFSATTPVTAAPFPAALTLKTLPAANSLYGQPVTLTATLTPDTSQGLTADGNVTFTGAPSLGTEPLVTGKATFGPISTLPVGAYNLSATYANDPNFTAAPATPVPFTVGMATPKVALAVTPAPVAPAVSYPFGTGLTFTVTVAGTLGAGITQPTGTVVFNDGAAILCAAPLTPGTATVGSTASCPVNSSLALGLHQITATYSAPASDPNYTSAPATAPLPITISKNAPTVSVTNALNPTSTFGTAVTFIATVQGISGATTQPTGSVNFADCGPTITTCTAPTGTPLVCTNANFGVLGTVNGTSTATCSMASLTGGKHNITATYAPGTDPNYSAAGPSTAFTQIVSPAAPTVAVSGSPTATYGQSVTFTATVSGVVSQSQPTGSVTFNADDSPLSCAGGLAPVMGVSTATCTTITLLGGTHSITAIYNKDTNYSAGNTGSVPQTVNRATATIAFNPSGPLTSTYGSSVTFTAAVTGVTGTGLLPPTGKVNFTDTLSSANPPSPATPICTPSPTITNGTASCTINSLSMGTHTIAASYGDDQNYQPGTSADFSQTVTTFAPGVVVTSSELSSTYGTPVAFKATVTGASTLPQPGGTVTFFDGGSPLTCGSTTPLEPGSSSSTATCTTNALTGGPHTITAAYAPSASSNYSAVMDSAATPAQQKVAPYTPTLAPVASTLNPSVLTSQITLTATVSGVTGLVSPTGSVTFTDGGSPVACTNSALLSATTPVGTSSATCIISMLTDGSHLIGATYVPGGDPNYATALTTQTITQTVQDYNLLLAVGAESTATTPTVNVTQLFNNTNDPFNTVSITARIQPLSMFSQSVNVTCVVTGPSGSTPPTCSPATTSLLGDGPSAASYTVATSASTTVGTYTVTLTASDPSVITLPAKTQTFTVNVLNNVPLALAGGASGTVTALVYSGSSTGPLSFDCNTGTTPILQMQSDGTLLPVSTTSIVCQGSASLSGGQQNLVPISINTAPTSSTSSLRFSGSSGIAAAAFIGIPLFALAGLFGRRSSKGGRFFRFLVLVVLIAGIGQAIGCGSRGFITPPPAASGTPPGTYVIHVSDPTKTYQAVVNLVVN